MLTLTRLGDQNIEDHALAEAIALFEGEATAWLYRIAWLLLDQDAEFMPLHLDENAMPTVMAFAEQYPNV